MGLMPSEPMLNWAAETVGAGAKVVAVKSLHGGYSPWLLRIGNRGCAREVVLRATVAGRDVFPFQLATGAAALEVAEQHGLMAPRLLAKDLDGRVTGMPATLETAVAGTSAIPTTVSADRLRAAGAAIAKVHKVPLEPRAELPLRIRSLQGPARLDEYALERRWSALYRSTSDTGRAEVVQALCELTGWSAQHARRVMANTHSTALLQRADDTLQAISRPQGNTVFVHADLWAGNMMWNADTCVTLIDWKDSGVGDAGVDLGHLRMKMAVQYGQDAAAYVLDGWQREMGCNAANVPYWDVVAAAHMPTELNDHEPGFDEKGNQIGSRGITRRRDAFLRNALDELGPEIARLRHMDANSG